MFTVSDHLPAFRMLPTRSATHSTTLNSVVSLETSKESETLARDSHSGKRPVVFSLLDFTFVCPAETAESSQGAAQ
jgi:alkyl hydroperoxide reductase subunit AhpC